MRRLTAEETSSAVLTESSQLSNSLSRALTRSGQSIAQLLANAQDNLTYFIANHAIVGPDVTPSSFRFQPGFIFYDFPN